MQVAFCSSDGSKVDVHFGHASRFLVYQVDENGFRFLGAKETTPYCSAAQRDHGYSEERMSPSVQQLFGCERIYVAGIGKNPAIGLSLHGIHAIVTDEALPSILQSLIQARTP